MSPELLTLLIVTPTVLVIAALVAVMWRGHGSRRESFVAVLAGVVLTLWAGIVSVLALRGFFVPPDSESAPPSASP
jgi:heme/copper-type cytochrome/quinol oxidase subunit 1